MELRDDEILLRPWEERDIPALVVGLSDPDVVRFMPDIPAPYTEADARAWLERCRQLAPDEFGYFAIVDASDKVLGGTGVDGVGEVRSIGYWITPAMRGRGIATRALRLLSHWAVTEGDVQRLELTTHPDNQASQRVAEKVGFTREGLLRAQVVGREGRRDSVMFSLLPGDIAPPAA
jgi:RimJ/RimL family protein N-acetyltransferase